MNYMPGKITFERMQYVADHHTQSILFAYFPHSDQSINPIYKLNNFNNKILNEMMQSNVSFSLTHTSLNISLSKKQNSNNLKNCNYISTENKSICSTTLLSPLRFFSLSISLKIRKLFDHIQNMYDKKIKKGTEI